MVSDLNGIELEINNKKTLGEFSNFWKSIKLLLLNHRYKIN